jgi:hypothetical protein
MRMALPSAVLNHVPPPLSSEGPYKTSRNLLPKQVLRSSFEVLKRDPNAEFEWELLPIGTSAALTAMVNWDSTGEVAEWPNAAVC